MLLVACEQGESSTGGAPGIQRMVRRGVLPGLHADSEAARANPLVALPITTVEHRAARIAALLFRFTLCTTIILVPQALAIRGFEPDQIGLRSSGVLCHLFLSRSRLHFCCYANSIPVSSRHRLACMPLLLVEFSIQQHVGPRTSTDRVAHRVGKRLLSSDLSAASCCKHLRRGFGQT